MGAKTEAQLIGERRLSHAQVAFGLIEKIAEMNSRVSVRGKILPCDPKFV